MNRSMPHVCLVTPGHLATNPRLVKEADALVAHGYRVSVVSARFLPWADAADREFDDRPWDRVIVPFGPLAGRPTWLRQGITQRVARALDAIGAPPRAAWRERAFHPVAGALAAAARRVRADLYIGHNLAGLCAAGHAAQTHGARLGFDAEDDHVGELPMQEARERARRDALQRRWIARCVHLTAAAPLMAARLGARYGREFVTVHNVFDAVGLGGDAGGARQQRATDLHGGRSGKGVSLLYWFSQTLGPGRGLEPLIDAIGRMHRPVRLALRGRSDAAYRDALRARVASLGLPADTLAIDAPIAPSALPATCAGVDLGVSVEIADVENREACLGNKIFQYLACGVPVLLSRTPAQDAFARGLGEAAVSIDLADAAATAQVLDRWFADDDGRIRARQAAAAAAATRWNWRVEQRVFLDSVARALATATVPGDRAVVAESTR